MRRYSFFSLLLVIIGYSCAFEKSPTPAPESVTQAFLANYTPFCGQSFRGETTHIELGEGHPLEGAKLLMTIESCNIEEIRIAFQVDEDRSRTWILGYIEDGLRLAHDHRYEDGSQYEANFYGGLAMDNGNGYFKHYPEGAFSTSRVLYFPADARTLSDRPSRDINVWSKAFDLENNRYYYRLYLTGELRYEAVFDLSSPVEAETATDLTENSF